MNDLHDALTALAARGVTNGVDADVIVDRVFARIDGHAVAPLVVDDRRRARRPRIVVPVAALIVLALVVPFALRRGGAPDHTPPANSTDVRAATAAEVSHFHWSTIPLAPLETTPPAQAVDRFHPVEVWDGLEVLIWGGVVGLNEVPRNDGVAYDPATRAWRTLPSAPISARTDAAAAWTGRELVVWGGEGDEAHPDGAAYSPATNTWRTIAPGPVCQESDPPSALWTGHVVVIVADTTDGSPPHGCARIAAYDPARDTWTRIDTPTLPGVVLRGVHPVDTDGRDVVATRDDEGEAVDWFGYDAARDEWRPIQPTSNESDTLLGANVPSTGRAILFIAKSSASVEDFRSGTTYSLPPPPDLEEENLPPVWTGHEFLFFGSYRPPGQHGYGDYGGLRLGP